MFDFSAAGRFIVVSIKFCNTLNGQKIRARLGRCASGLALSLISNHYSLINFSCPRQLKFHIQTSVAGGAVAHVDPAAAFLVDALVDGEVEALDQGKQAAVGAWRADGDVGGLATLVLAVGGNLCSFFYNLIEHIYAD